MWISNQQFTIRNVKITNAVSAIYQLWNWYVFLAFWLVSGALIHPNLRGFTWQGITIQSAFCGCMAANTHHCIRNCQVGFDLATGGLTLGTQARVPVFLSLPSQR
jgi:hypothetical protein